MNHNIILFGLLAIIFIVIITLSLKLNSLRRNRLLPCDNEKTNINTFFLRNFMNFIANRIQVVNHDGEINITDVERIVISDYCLQSCFCKHDCEIYYKDGSMKKIRHNGRYIAQNYFDILNDEDKMHFYVYLK